MKQEALQPQTDLAAKAPGTKLSFEERIMSWFIANWKNVLVALVVAGALVYSYQGYQQAKVASLELAADSFSNLRTRYDELTKAYVSWKDAEAKMQGGKADPKSPVKSDNVESLRQEFENQKVKFEQQLASIADSKEPYNLFGGLYKALVAAQTGDTVNIPSALSPLDVDSYSSKSGSERLVSELGALLKYRSQLDSDYLNGRKGLIGLVTGAQYVNISAAFAVARVSSTDAEKKEALELLSALKAAHPEQGDILDPEIERLNPN